LVEIDPAVASQNLLRACREDDYETAMEYLEGKEIKVDYEDSEKWTPLSWSSCNGNEKLVKIMLREHNAAAMYMQVKEEEDEVDSNHDPFKKPKIASEVGRYTPLHWASYKSHYRIVWILLKEGLSPLDIDVFGNTAVHQAAAAGSIQVLQ
jgi:ankyrin repeat protein